MTLYLKALVALILPALTVAVVYALTDNLELAALVASLVTGGAVYAAPRERRRRE